MPLGRQYPSIPPLHIIHLNYNTSKIDKRDNHLDFSDNSEPYSQPFSTEGLRTALGKAHDTAPGPDQIHNQILKHLPEASLQFLTIFGKLESFHLPGEKTPSYPLPSQEK